MASAVFVDLGSLYHVLSGLRASRRISEQGQTTDRAARTDLILDGSTPHTPQPPQQLDRFFSLNLSYYQAERETKHSTIPYWTSFEIDCEQRQPR